MWRFDARGEEFTYADGEYADDTGLLFCSRTDVEEQGPKAIHHFGEWGMEIHAGILDSDPLITSGLLDPL